MKKLSFLLVLCFPCLIFGVESRKEEMLRDFETIQNTFEVKYAPSEWKKQYLGWDIKEASDKAKKQIVLLKKPSVKDYQHIVSLFLNSMHDFHVKVLFYSTEQSFLPFRIDTAEGRYFVGAVHSAFKKEYPNLLNKGDEILAFDGQPIQKILNKFLAWNSENRDSATDIANAASYLTARIAQLGHKVPEGLLTVTVKHADTGFIELIPFEWIYVPERIQNRYQAEFMQKKPKHSLLDIDMGSPTYGSFKNASKELEAVLGSEEKEDSMWRVGAKKSFVPDLGKKLWEHDSESFFYAYLYQTKEGNRIGYIRIPDFMPENEEIPKEFEKIISFLEDHSDALIIDQVDNPGGSMFFMYALASMLTDYPLIPTKMRETLTQEEVYTALQEIDALENILTDKEAVDEFERETLHGFPVNYELVRSLTRYYRFIVDEWNKGARLTKLNYINGVDKIRPSPKSRYTKPILILVNELSISAADFFPALLQDNGRAKVFGAKTAGAGGAVRKASHPNIFGIAYYTYTATFAERSNRDPIENLGVQPDIPYAVTADDLKNGYCGYAAAVNEAIKEIFIRSEPL